MRAPTTVERAAQVAYNLMCQSTTCSALLGRPYGDGTVYPMYNGGPYLDANGQVVLEADGSPAGGGSLPSDWSLPSFTGSNSTLLVAAAVGAIGVVWYLMSRKPSRRYGRR